MWDFRHAVGGREMHQKCVNLTRDAWDSAGLIRVSNTGVILDTRDRGPCSRAPVHPWTRLNTAREQWTRIVRTEHPWTRPMLMGRVHGCTQTWVVCTENPCPPAVFAKKALHDNAFCQHGPWTRVGCSVHIIRVYGPWTQVSFLDTGEHRSSRRAVIVNYVIIFYVQNAWDGTGYQLRHVEYEHGPWTRVVCIEPNTHFMKHTTGGSRISERGSLEDWR